MAIKHYREASGDLATRLRAIKLEVAERTRIGQLKEAREEGIEIGEQRGEHRKAVETARKMAARGMDPSLITEMTGLKPKDWQ